MRRHLLALVVVAVPLASALTIAQSPLSRSGGSGVDVQSMDMRVEARTDFYQFACGGLGGGASAAC